MAIIVKSEEKQFSKSEVHGVIGNHFSLIHIGVRSIYKFGR